MGIFDQLLKKKKSSEGHAEPKDCADPKPIQNHTDDASAVKENANEFQILDFYLDCSHWRRQHEILEKTPLALSVKRVDVEKEDSVVQKYKVNNLPKLILVDSSGNEIMRWKGITESSEINEYLYENGYAERPAVRKESSSQESDSKVDNPIVFKPFNFHSDCHQRYKNGEPEGELQVCGRSIQVEKNVNGCSGYNLTPGDGYIIRATNDDTGKPQFAAKPMRVIKTTENSVVLRGYKTEAMGPFGWVDFDGDDYGFEVCYESGRVSKCILYMHDRNVRLEYMQQKYSSKSNSNSEPSSSPFTKAELLAQSAIVKARIGDGYSSNILAIQSLKSLLSDPSQFSSIKDSATMALALGKMMEGDNFSEKDDIIRAVSITYYFICKAIAEGNVPNPYIYVYKFSTEYEYNKTMYMLMAHSEGKEYYNNPMDIMSQISMMTYDHNLEGMMMADMFTEPMIAQLDQALNNIFNQTYAKYRGSDKERVKELAKGYTDAIYKYLCMKIKSNDFDF